MVEMDEFHLYTPKHHKGRPTPKGVVWGFGGIDVNTRDVFVVPVKKWDKATLLPLIRKFIYPETTIYTDSWTS
jgi:transposase-like protein